MKRVNLLGCEIDTYSFDEAVNKALEYEKGDKVAQVVTINPEMIDCAKNDSDFAHIIKSAEMIIPDGVGIKIGLKILGERAHRIAGIDFARALLEKSAQENLPVALVGAKPEIVEKAAEELKNEINNLNVVYYHDGYFSDNGIVLDELKGVAPRLILVALGSPKQEKFIAEAKSVLPYGLMIGVGGSFDVWSGNVERAPEIYQKLGIEWLYRTLKQPERFKRIFPTLPLFVLRVLKEKFFGKK